MAVKKKTIKEKKFTTKMRKKLLVVFFIVGAALIALSIVMIRLNLNKGEDYSQAVYDNFTYDSQTITAKRGDITDRNGTILAYSVKVYNLILDAKVLLSKEEYEEPTETALLQYFPDLSKEELNSYIEENKNKDTKDSYKRLLLSLSAEDIADFQTAMEDDSNIKGIWFEEEYERVYPYDSFASDAIGFLSETDSGERGENGVESYYNSYLAGVNGRTYGYINDSSYVSETINPTDGDTVVTTIDYTIQNIVEDAINEFNEENGSLSTTVIVMDPNNGEVLALADYPSFDLNNPRDLSSLYTEEELAAMTDSEIKDAYYSLWKDYATSTIYEPGSVFKSFVIASALEEGIVEPNDIWTCDGVQVYNGATIHCHDGVGHGDITTVGALALSCNDAMMQIAEKLGIEKYNEYLRLFQFGRKTGIDLPSEEQGITINEEGMMAVDLATNSFGQNISVNMFQMCSAFASLINGGYYYEPHIVKEIQNSSGDVVKTFDSEVISKTISTETSDLMKQFLRATVDFGTPMIVQTDGYSIGGKTGTAQKAGRVDDSYVVSFMGFLTAEDPQFLVYVVIDSPQIGEYYNSSAAQMVFHSIFEKLTLYYGISIGVPDYTLQFKIYADDEDWRTSIPWDPSTALTTPVEEDEEDKINSIDEDDRIDGTDTTDNGDGTDSGGDGADNGDANADAGDGADNGDANADAGDGADNGDANADAGDGADNGDANADAGDGADNGDVNADARDGADNADANADAGDGADNADANADAGDAGN